MYCLNPLSKIEHKEAKHKNAKRRKQTMEQEPTQQIAEHILYDLWFSIAESIFERVCVVTHLSEEQKQALREVALRPNDFQIYIEK